MNLGENKNKRSLGNQGEKIAAEYLKKNGYQILTQNFRYSRLGEIDIISQEKEYLCFVEVKTRSSSVFGMPSEAVNRKKQGNIRTLAQIYLKQNNLRNVNVRFDVIEIIVERKSDRMDIKSINLIKNAF